MSYNIPSHLAKFDELIPCHVPFVEGKVKGHQDRTNYSIIGPGVVEDTKQGVKIAEEHGFNIEQSVLLRIMAQDHIVIQQLKFF